MLLFARVDQTGMHRRRLHQKPRPRSLELGQGRLHSAQRAFGLARELTQRLDDPVAVLAEDQVVGHIGLHHLRQRCVEVSRDALHLLQAGTHVVKIGRQQPRVLHRVFQQCPQRTVHAVEEPGWQL